MNDVRGIVEELESSGLEFWEDRGKLKFRGPQGMLTPDRREVLVGNREAVLELIRGRSKAIQPHPETATEPFPLTDVQSAYLLGRRDVFDYGGVACHAYGEMSFESLDIARLEEALNRLISRHDMLRAVVDYSGFQRVLPNVARYMVEVRDVTGLPPTEQDSVLAGTRARLDHESRDPSTWPLFSFAVTRLGDRSVLHISLDFLIADYVSIYLLLDELGALYEAPEQELPQLDLTFRDYLLAAQATRQGPAYERARDYWLSRIETLPPAPELPLAASPHRSGAAAFRRHQFFLDDRLWTGLGTNAIAHGVTSSTAVMTVYADVLGRWSRRQDFTLDVTILSRESLHPQVGSVVGDFTSVELLRVDGAGGSFADRATALGMRLLEDLDHRAFTGVEVLRELARTRGQEFALMPVVYTSAIGLSQSQPLSSLFRGGLDNGISQTPQVWIDCQVMERDGGLGINWDVRTGVLPEGLVEDMFAAFAEGLQRISTDESAWSDADVVSIPAGQLATREAVNATSRPVRNALLHQDILDWAQDHPADPAVIDHAGSVSYGELVARAQAVAAALQANGVEPGSMVGVVMSKGWEQVAGVLAILLAGCAYVPVDLHQPRERRDTILRDANVRAVLLAPRDGIQDIQAELVLAVEAGTRAPRSDTLAAPATDSGALAYAIYTSGTTGTPKGVMISHRAAVNTIDDIRRRLAITEADRAIAIAQLGFDLSVFDIFGVLGVGGTLVMPRTDRLSDPSHWVDLVREHGVSLINCVPGHAMLLADYLKGVSLELGGVRNLMMSGDWIPVPLPGELRGQLPAARLWSLGGATEASIWSIIHPIDVVDETLPSIPYGTPLENQGFQVLDSQLRPAPELVPGDLYITGEGLALGYLGDQSRTAEWFLELPTGERAYRTGDLGRYLRDGAIEFLGREDGQVKIRGYRVEVGDVESVLTSDPVVAAAAVIVEGERNDKRLLAFVESARAEGVRNVGSLVEAVTTDAGQVRVGVDVAKVVEFAKVLDHTALHQMVEVLRRCGLWPDDRASHDAAEIMSRASVASKHERLVRRWLAALVDEGYLALSEDRYRCLRLVEPDHVQTMWEEVERRLPEAHDRPELVTYFREASQHLPELLRDEQDPVQLLFPEGRLDIQEAAYMEGFLSRYLNRLATATVRRVVDERDDASPVEVLEVGAGVGGTSVDAVAMLDGADVHYLFTDVSQFFLNKASERFTDAAWVDYAMYDMNDPYREQGLMPNSVDVILCGNVMHYSKDASRVLARFRELLTGDGWLVFIETTRDNYQILTSMEFLFDADAGDFEDVRAGQDQTFIRREQWELLLKEAGAELVFCIPDQSDELAQIGMHVFAARFKTDRRRVTASAVLDRLRERLPAEMIPFQLQVLDSLPLTDNGKIDRARLQKLALTRTATTSAEHGTTRQLTPVEARIAAIWAGALKVGSVGVDDNFYESGGDSLLAAQIVTSVRAEVTEARDIFFDELLRELLNGSSVAELAQFIGGGETEQADSEAPEVLSILGPEESADVTVILSDGFGEEAAQSLAASLARSSRVVLVPPIPSGSTPAAALLDLAGAETAARLRELSPGPFHVVGAHSGALLGLIVAQQLAQSGVSVTGLTVVSSYPLPGLVEDAVLAEYLLARGAGVSAAVLEQNGYPTEQTVADVLRTSLEKTPGLVPDGALASHSGSQDTPASRNRLAEVLGIDIAALEQRLARARLWSEAIELCALDPFVGDVRLLRHREESAVWPTLGADAEQFWGELCLGDLTTIEVAGDHFSCRGEDGLAAVIAERKTL